MSSYQSIERNAIKTQVMEMTVFLLLYCYSIPVVVIGLINLGEEVHNIYSINKFDVLASIYCLTFFLLMNGVKMILGKGTNKFKLSKV